MEIGVESKSLILLVIRKIAEIISIPIGIRVCHECHWSLRSLTISDREGVFQPIINIIYNIYYDGECIRKSLMTLLTRDTLDTPCRMEVYFF